MEISFGQRIELREGLSGPVQSSQSLAGTKLVGDGNQSRPAWRGKTGAADLVPGVGTAAVVRIVNSHAGIGIGVKGHVRNLALS